MERIANCILRCAWSGCVWSKGERKESNFVSADWAVLDFDDGEMALSEALEEWSDTVHIIGTTKTHQVLKSGRVCDRFRVALLLDQTITDIRAYRYTMSLLVKKYPADKGCRDGARFFWPCTKIVSIGGEASCFFEKANLNVPENFEKENEAKIARYQGSLILTPSLALKIKTPILEGKINTTLYGFGRDLAKYGFSLEESINLIARCNVVDLGKDDYMQGLVNGHNSIKKEKPP